MPCFIQEVRCRSGARITTFHSASFCPHLVKPDQEVESEPLHGPYTPREILYNENFEDLSDYARPLSSAFQVFSFLIQPELGSCKGHAPCFSPCCAMTEAQSLNDQTDPGCSSANRRVHMRAPLRILLLIHWEDGGATLEKEDCA